LKCIGVGGVILAHLAVPQIVLQLRSFDVPLLVIISAVLANESFEKKNNGIILFDYIWKRIKRLVLPTWTFLVFFFLFQCVCLHKIHPLSYYFNSFIFAGEGGIGYVWIVLIYLYCAILSPLFYRVKDNRILAVVISGSYILYEIIYGLGYLNNRFALDTICNVIPYGALTYLGIRYKYIPQKKRLIICVIFFLLFIAFGIYYNKLFGRIKIVSVAKYPPRMYYLSYGIFSSFVLLMICEKIDLPLLHHGLITFISSHSFWIYLWHIFYITILRLVLGNAYWYLQFVILMICCVGTVWLQNTILDHIEKNIGRKVCTFLRG
jgi:hypothetical protein